MAGLAHNTSNVDRTSLATGTRTNCDNSQDNLALGAAAGFDYALSDHWDLGAAYRFIYLGGFDTGPMLAGDSFGADDMVSHDLVLSIEYRF